MVAFADKLARLKMPRRRKLPAAEQEGQAEQPQAEQAQAEIHGEELLAGRADQAAAALPVADRLALLRGALGRMLGSPASGPAATHIGPTVTGSAAAGPAAAGASSLPVERCSTQWGDLDMLRSEHSLDEHLGEGRRLIGQQAATEHHITGIGLDTQPLSQGLHNNCGIGKATTGATPLLTKRHTQ